MNAGLVGLVILLGTALGLSICCFIWFKQSFFHACMVGVFAYLALQIGNTIHLGYIDPYFILGLPVSCACSVAIYYAVFALGKLFKRS